LDDRWAVPLDGESLDVEEAKRLWAEGPIRVRDIGIEHGRYAVAMQADDFEQQDDYIEVLATAERLLDYVNGALFLTDIQRRPLCVVSGGTVRERSETGIYDRRSVLGRLSGGFRARARFYGVLTTADGQQSEPDSAPRRPVEAEALALCVNDKAVADVLSYLRADPDHVILFNVYERIESDVNEARRRWRLSGRIGAPPGFPWTDGEKRKLKWHSQPFRHGDPESWGGLTREAAMPLAEARAMVKEWTRKWLEQKHLIL
jgi:hypothetical protein